MLRITIDNLLDMRERQKERGIANTTFEKEPFLFVPNDIVDATLEYTDESMPIKRFMTESLTPAPCPAGMASQYPVSDVEMVMRFNTRRSQEGVGLVMKWVQ